LILIALHIGLPLCLLTLVVTNKCLLVVEIEGLLFPGLILKTSEKNLSTLLSDLRFFCFTCMERRMASSCTSLIVHYSTEDLLQVIVYFFVEFLAG